MQRRGFWFWEDERNARLYEPGTVDKIFALHGRVLGRTVTVVTPTVDAVYIRILPTYSEGYLDRVIGEGLTHVWANVTYIQGRGYECVVRGPELDTEGWQPGWSKRTKTWHTTLQAALRRVRKTVGRHAQQRPESGWTKRFRVSLVGRLESPFPSSGDYAAAEMEDKMIQFYDEGFETLATIGGRD